MNLEVHKCPDCNRLGRIIWSTEKMYPFTTMTWVTDLIRYVHKCQ